MIGLRAEGQQGKYLGLPAYVGKSHQACFEYIRDQIWELLQEYKIKVLSKKGKEILIKTVLQAMPAYAVVCFDLTKALCESISQMICRFWWANQYDERKHHWAGWEKMTLLKEEGGLGFRDLHSFNMAMLARQVCRLIQALDSLCARVLRAKYY